MFLLFFLGKVVYLIPLLSQFIFSCISKARICLKKNTDPSPEDQMIDP